MVVALESVIEGCVDLAFIFSAASLRQGSFRDRPAVSAEPSFLEDDVVTFVVDEEPARRRR